ncbi:MAG: Ig-like domain-containing protein [Saprospiraceae bacterium]
MKQLLIIFISIIILASCANIQSPTGGERDRTPPQIDSSETFTPNFKTNFSDKQIILPFDEWIVLNDVLNQVVVSPPLEKPIDMKLKKRTVVIDFSEETLRENTTYTINFGESIKDLNEGNIPKNFRYIFSTGDVIDSLEVNGNVIDALTEAPIEDILVVLYDDLTDSVVHKERPYYFTRTDKNGRFNIPFVKQDTFKIFALKDENANYKYDSENEQIAFSNEFIITGDTLINNPTLRFFQEKPSVRTFRPKSPHYGYIPIIFTTDNLENVKFDLLTPVPSTQWQNDSLESLIYFEKDTLKYWYRNVELDSVEMVVFDNQTLRDTFIVKLNSKAEYLKSNPKVWMKTQKNTANINPNQKLTFTFNRPISTIDKSRVLLFEDSVLTTTSPQFTIDSVQKNVLHFTYKWKEKKFYDLVFADSSLFDFHQITNDTLQTRYYVEALKKFGNITATASGLEASKAYIIQILTEENVVEKEFYVKDKTEAKQQFFSLEPKNYKLRVIIDENANQVWDTGDYPNTQPEKVIMAKETTNLRPNWELDLTIQLNN